MKSGAKPVSGRVSWRPSTTFVLMLVLLLSATALVGCGSSATTSPAEAKMVAVVEHKFGMRIRRAVTSARAQCSEKSGRVEESCFQKLVFQGEGKPTVAFEAAIEELLDSGVGPDCTEVLEEALATINSVPLFPGGTASICLSESRH